jgi:uncharacterized protein (DUF1778 family)
MVIRSTTEGITMGKSEAIKIRVEPEEKEAFQQAAEIAGIPLSNWMRERLRKAARVELQDVGKQVPFLIIKD